MDKDGKALPVDPVAAKKLKLEAPEPRKAAPTYIPQGPLKSKYHVQVRLGFLLVDVLWDPVIGPVGR